MTAETTRRFQLVLVVETNDISMTDDPYYSWILRNFFAEYVQQNKDGHATTHVDLIFNFVHAGGWSNYNKKKVKDEIRGYKNSFYAGPTYVLYCMDYDTNSNETAERIKNIREYCESKGYFLSVAYPEIECVTFPNRGGRDKVAASRYFASHWPKKTTIKEDCIFADSDSVLARPGKTTFGTVVNQIISRYLTE